MRLKQLLTVAGLGLLPGAFGLPFAGAVTGNVEWVRQFGTGAVDVAEDVSVDGEGNVYVTGRTEGSLGGPNAGGYDAFLSKYDSSGASL